MKIEDRLWLSFGVVVIVLLAMIGATLWNTRELERSTEWRRLVHSALIKMRDVELAVLRAELAAMQVASGDSDEFKVSLEVSIREAERRLQELQLLTSDHDVHAHFRALSSRLSEHIAALGTLESGRAASITRAVHDLQAAEERLLAERTAVLKKRQFRVQAAAIATGIVGVLLFGIATQVTQRELRLRARAEKALRMAHESLETKVAERTKELSDANVRLAIEVSQHAATAETLAHERELMKVVFDSVDSRIVACDRDGHINLMNRAAREIFGDPPSSLSVDDWPSFLRIWSSDGQTVLPKEQIPLFRAFSGERFSNVEVTVLSRNGTQRRVSLVSGQPITGPGGVKLGAVVAATDITERKKMEMQILRAQRMESIGTLSGGIAHDLNNVLAPVLMGVPLLLAECQDAGIRKVGESIQRSAERGAELIKQILGFARGGEGEKQVFQPSHVIGEVVSVCRKTFPKGIEIQCTTDKRPWPIIGDPTNLHQVMMNLCVNARDAMGEEGSLVIRLENVSLSERELSAQPDARPGPYIMIKVTDAGSGIPPDILNQIFDPFFTTKEVGRGTGLGLSTVYSIVKGHGGFIKVYSEVGHGTTFAVYIPGLPGAREAEALSDNTIATGSGETILLVDDEPTILATTREALQRSGYKVTAADNGAEAVVAYAALKKTVSLVITDINMPVMSGRALVAALEKLNPEIRVIATSGLPHKFDMPGAVKAFVSKPYTPQKLLSVVAEVLGR